MKVRVGECNQCGACCDNERARLILALLRGKDMRSRTIIEKDPKVPELLSVELLLDIRELLQKISKSSKKRRKLNKIKEE